MKRYVYSLFIILLIIFTSIAYLGNVSRKSIKSYAIKLVDTSSDDSNFDRNKEILIENINKIKPLFYVNTHQNRILESLRSDNISNSLKPANVLSYSLSSTSKTSNTSILASKIDFVNKYTNILECNLNNYSKIDRVYLINNYEKLKHESKQYNYSSPAPRELYNTRITRAILVYFPIEINADYILEFKWMYRSWIEMQKNEPSLWRTDIVAFIDNDLKYFNDNNFFLKKLNCSFENKRKSNLDEPMCTLINYKPLKNRQLVQNNIKIFNSSEKYEYLLKRIDIFSDDDMNLAPFYEFVKENIANYGYLDSILMAFDGYKYLKSAGYNFLIRSDMDVFFTPLFAKWLPKNCNDFYVGRGGYSTQFNIHRLNRIAKEIGFLSASEENLGSTWYSTVEQFRLVSYLTLFSMSFLSAEEFTPPEKSGQLGVLMWPYWHYGVLLLYGQSLAMNHLIKSNQLNIIKIHDQLDYPSYYSDDINKMIHLHVFHGDDMFSKFEFKNGKYDKLNPDSFNVLSAKYYALKMALDGKRISEYGLSRLLKYEISKKS